ncbi:MAG TPA: YciI family protein [Vicinamibacteria bacterium]|nr:YciI family protein [Vicinamibacteria bacterium]
MKLTLWSVPLVIGAVGVASAASEAPDAAPKRKTYLVVFKPGPAWLPGRPVTEQPIKEHGPYMLGLFKKGIMKFAGPFSDGSGGAYVFEAASDEEADAIVAADPAVIDKVFVPERHPWYLVDWERRAQAAR